MSQQRSSAATSQRQVPALIKIGDARGYWRRRTINLDLGGGKYELTTEALAYRGVYSRVTDPFNRSAAHNIDVAEWVKRYNGVDTVTCANVLNVIDSAYAIGTVIREAFDALRPGGTAYFTVYQGDRSSMGHETTKGWQANRPTSRS